MSTSAQSAVAKLSGFDEEQLFAELGKRLNTIGYEPHLSADFDLTVPKKVESLGLLDDFRAFGERFFSRVNVQAYGLVCGSDATDKEAREKLAQSMNLGKDMFAVTLAGLLVGQLGLAPAIAPIVALLIVRLFFKPALGAMCDVWKGKLPKSPS